MNLSETKEGRITFISRLILMALVFSVVVCININTVINNAYYYGATVNDSVIFETIIWRSGPALMPAASVYPLSFFNIHISPVHYLANALSYVVNCDVLTYYAWVYAVIYGLLAIVVFDTFYHFYPRFKNALALASTVAFQFSGVLISGQWEPHQEIICPLAIILFFRAWDERNYQPALWWLFLNSSVREDAGILLAMPLFLLTFAERFLPDTPEKSIPETSQGQNEDAVETTYTDDNSSENSRRRFWIGIGLSAAAVITSVASVVYQKTFFPAFNMFSVLYYGKNPIEHLNPVIIVYRFHHLIAEQQYLWVPCLLLIVGGLVLRDARLSVGGIAYLPYWAACFFAKLELAALMQSYKPFPLITIMVWPAIFSKSIRRHKSAYVILQIGILVAGIIGWDGEKVEICAPIGVQSLMTKWILQPESKNTENYERFGELLRRDRSEFGELRGSSGVISMYPYDFPIWWKSQMVIEGVKDFPKLDTIIWFDGDRDDGLVQKTVKELRLKHIYEITGTKLLIASKRDLHKKTEFQSLLKELDY